jgi:photosystem II stability/assembly factor-like uncharacterized protein
MKKLIVLFIATFSLHLQAEWKRPNQDHSLKATSSVIINANLRFSIEGHYIYKSTDQGKFWQKDSLDLNIKNFYIAQQSIQFSDESNIFIFLTLQDRIYNNMSGRLFKTADLGKTWVEIPLNVQIDYHSRLCVAGKQWLMISRDRLAWSDDEGKIWQELKDQLPDPVILDLKVVSEKQWYLITNNDRGNIASVYLSTDQGKDWQAINKIDLSKDSLSMPTIFAGDMQAKGNHLYIVLNIYFPGCGYYYDHSLLCHLQNRIHSWELSVMAEMRLEHISKIYFTSDDTAYALSGNTIYKTLDGGKTWFRTYQLDYTDGLFTDLVLMDGKLMSSTSKGVVIINENSGNDANLSVEDGHSMSEILVYPNPAGEILNIRLPEITAHCKVSLMNETGQAVLDSIYENCSLIEINTSTLAPGIYIYAINTGSKSSTGKIIIR